MADFVIYTDTGADISYELLADWGVKCADLTFIKNGDESKVYTNHDITSKEFYEAMRQGAIFKTAGVTPDQIEGMMIPDLQAGKDILYVVFSSGLSVTYNSARLAAEKLREDFPDRKIYAIDSLCASAGEGLLVYLAVLKQKEGATIEETAAYVEECIPKLAHSFTVSDLVYLKRGGRISAASYFAATALDIKPVMHVDDEGHLASIGKVRGRKKSIKEMFAKYEKTALDPENGLYFISHGDCMDDAKALEAMINEKYGKKCDLITNVGSVIGSHSGPGTLALFFLATGR